MLPSDGLGDMNRLRLWATGRGAKRELAIKISFGTSLITLTKRLLCGIMPVEVKDMDYESTIRRIREIEEQLTQLPPGSLVYKNIRDKKQPYLQWYEDGKPKSQYIKVDHREETIAKAMRKKELTAELKALKSSLPSQPETIIPAYRTNVMYGVKLNAQIQQVADYKKRDCYQQL